MRGAKPAPGAERHGAWGLCVGDGSAAFGRDGVLGRKFQRLGAPAHFRGDPASHQVLSS